MSDTSRQDAAMTLWRQGYHIIPTAEKNAAVKWKRNQTRQPTAAQVRKWWPPGSRRNIALLLGPRLGVLCLNVNMKHGDDGLRTLRREEWTVPATPTIHTAHHGFAHLFRVPDRERYPVPFKTHQRLESLPGLELRGEGGYQLVPPSRVNDTDRNPAGDYAWLEVWSPERLIDDLAEMPDWLLTLWITSDRAGLPARPPQTSPLKSEGGNQDAGPPVTTERKSVSTNMCLLASSYVLTNHPSLEAGLAEVLRLPDVNLACARFLGLPVEPVGRAFRCVLPGHEETQPSAALWWDAKTNMLKYRDFHQRSGPEWFFLVDVYRAFKTGHVGWLRGPSLATWQLRLLVEAGVLAPYAVPQRALPDDASLSVRKVYRGFCELLACKWLHTAGRPSPFSWTFAAEWCGVGERQAGEAMAWLLRRGYLVKVGTHKRATLFRLGQP